MNLKMNAGYAAGELVKDGQVLGLGTGSTTHYFIEKVGKRVEEEELELDDFLLEAVAKKLKDNYVFTVKKQDGSTKDINIKPEVHTVNEEEVRKYGIGFDGTTHKKGFMNAVSYAFEGFYSNTITIIKIVVVCH